jgi:hypothetical protein
VEWEYITIIPDRSFIKERIPRAAAAAAAAAAVPNKLLPISMAAVAAVVQLAAPVVQAAAEPILVPFHSAASRVPQPEVRVARARASTAKATGGREAGLGKLGKVGKVASTKHPRLSMLMVGQEDLQALHYSSTGSAHSRQVNKVNNSYNYK